MINVKPQLETLEAYVPGKPASMIKKQYGLEQVIKLASNENPFGASPKVKEALQNFNDFAIYPDGAASQLREKLAARLTIDPKQLLFGAGGDEVIQVVCRGILSPGDNIIEAWPTFSQYSHHAIIEGAQIKNIPLKDGIHDLPAMLEAIDGHTKIIWVCNPNNPTGTTLTSTDIAAFLEQVPSEILVVVDEAYIEYANSNADCFPLLKRFENLFILRTFSKIYGLASFRIGYGIASIKLIQDLEASRLPFNTSSISQLAALAALEDQAFLSECVQDNLKGLKQYEEYFGSKGVAYYPSQANFIFIPTTKGKTIAAYLESKGYIIRSFSEGIRITIGTQKQNAALIKLLDDCL